MGETAFISGGSGFLGTYLTAELLEAGCDKAYILMRGESGEACAHRLQSLWWRWPELCSRIGRDIVPVAGDITEENLGLDAEAYESLAREVNLVVHAAAEIGVNETVERFGDVNVTGTLNMLMFAYAAQRAGGLSRFVHISTAYVAGTRGGLVTEDDLSEIESTQFNSLYEQTKHAAELLVRDAGATLPTSIVRPAQIVGDSVTGFAATFNTMYYPLKLYLKGSLPVIPASPSMRVNMVPVDYVARLAARAALGPQAVGKTFHAVMPTQLQPTVGELLAFVRTWAKENLGFDPGAAFFAPVPGASAAGRARNLASSASAKRKGPLQNMLALAPYFTEDRTYATTNTESLMGPEAPRWQDYLPALLEYATRKGFLNHTSRTVFEQALVRMTSRKASIDYYDASASGMRKTSGADVKADIVHVARTLRSRGVNAGDRVALVGVNSTRYFIADAAIGLVGATSVPLYYTSPVADVVDLVKRSHAVFAFVGTEKLARELPEALDAPLVSLLDESFEGVESWADFIGSGEGMVGGEGEASGNQETGGEGNVDWLPPSYGDIATIRYTSGTTGKPKGVMFDHAQLRWMGETMPSLLDWKTRNSKMRYLSFLPMSHVVEGILVAYAPYYMLTDIEMYFLNDFPLLVETLPKVRPTLFFSVPRFYEKLWDQFATSDAGKRYLAMDDGPAKRALARVARAVLLRKAGLDKCRQLIVGSAPVSMELLESFRDLGIEIHNAYGVTEAPLIALSRLGENELGSVGALLPDTRARISDEGEIFVAGPQVTAGYDGQGGCLDEDGFFATGDFGSWSAAGNLVIGGRKKELVVTSYGKNVSPEKVETLLKSIPGVSEALLVGEGRPYVSALMWLEDDSSAFDGEALDQLVRLKNTELSHPEQAKRWAVMDEQLSIANGDLTPNLKLRRSDVAKRLEASIDALYADNPVAEGMPGALHVGREG